MEPKQHSYEHLLTVLVGGPEFSRRLSTAMSQISHGPRCVSGTYQEGWSLILSQRPHIAFLEVGFQYSERTHAWMREFLTQVRERLGEQIAIIVAITDPEKLFFAGDLLFASDRDLLPSGWIDSFIVTPPGNTPSTPDLASQAQHCVQLYAAEFQRRAMGRPALQPLASAGWVQSLADPQSRELWMRWLPRYATYTNENPIIIGATGTGKTNLAFALHRLSQREGKFVGITPRDFSSSELVQAELFGAVAGAYTGAVDKWGLVKSAERGTLFIDELQSIDKDLQGKLITFIENKCYRRVGSAESITADVRFVFASNRTLNDMMTSEVLRDDFAYRLERVQLSLAALRERRLDIPAALAFSLAKIHRQRPMALPIHGVTSHAYRLLFAHAWPGNLRQLENTTAQLCELGDMQEKQLIDEDIVTSILQIRSPSRTDTGTDIVSHAALTLAKGAVRLGIGTVEQGTKALAEGIRHAALEACGGDVGHAAQIIQDHPTGLALFAEGADPNPSRKTR